MTDNSNGTSFLNHQRIEYMQRLISYYDSNIRGKDCLYGNHCFWDVVVITAGDNNQKSWFEHELCQLQPVLPAGITFRVFADPNSKLRTGCGGATLQAIHLLHEEFGNRLFDGMKILLIHAGGYSKRMPIHSFTNKLFTSLPVSINHSTPYTMLDMKMFMYLPFAGLMTGGIFSVTADDLEGFCIKNGELEKIQEELEKHKDIPYLCAMAHPAPISMGIRHGVYKLNEVDIPVVEMDVSNQVPSIRLITECPEVLQKVSEAKLREKAMVLSSTGEDFVLTDSTYWLNPCLMKRFLKFYSDQPKPISCETSVYADFITCQGLDLNGDYVTKVLAVDPQSSEAARFRREVCLMMKEVPLFVLVLPVSTYNDLGTLPEYIDALCGTEKQLGQEMSFARIVSSKFGKDSAMESSRENVEGVVISSMIQEPHQHVPKRVVIEHCRFEEGHVMLSENTILSGCHIIPSTISGCSIPGGYIYHTVPIKEREPTVNKTQFVTIAFHINDDLKSPCPGGFDELMIGNINVKAMFEEVINVNDLIDEGEVTLWNARIFPAKATRAESFSKSVEIISGGKQSLRDGKRYGMAELVTVVDKSKILDREFVNE